MDNKVLPSNLSAVLFTDKSGVSREGVYKKGLNAFVESLGDEGPEDPGNLYPEDIVVSWEYLDERGDQDNI